MYSCSTVYSCRPLQLLVYSLYSYASYASYASDCLAEDDGLHLLVLLLVDELLVLELLGLRELPRFTIGPFLGSG